MNSAGKLPLPQVALPPRGNFRLLRNAVLPPRGNFIILPIVDGCDANNIGVHANSGAICHVSSAHFLLIFPTVCLNRI
jgi:hypothetical protein